MLRFKKKKEKKYNIPYSRLFITLIIIVTLFTGVCYATLTTEVLDINGEYAYNKIDGVVITNVEFANTEGSTADLTNSSIVDYTSTVISSDLILSKTDGNSSITLKVSVHNNSKYNEAFSGYLYYDNVYDNDNIVFTITGIEENEVIKPSGDKVFYVTFKYKDNVVSEDNELISLIDYQFKKIYNITYKNFYDTEGLPTTIYEGEEKAINLSIDYQTVRVFSQDGSALLYDINYRFEEWDDSNLLTLLSIEDNIEIRNMTDFCSEGSELTNCLITTDYGSGELTKARENIESKKADFSKVEPNISYVENIEKGVTSPALATFDLDWNMYYSTEEPTFNTSTGGHTLSNYKTGTINDVISDENGIKYYTCLTVVSSCTKVYVVYSITTNTEDNTFSVTKADRYSYAISDEYSSNAGLYAIDDEYTEKTGEKSYYYRGEVKNNWVKFGTETIYVGFQSSTSKSFKEYNSLSLCENSSTYSTNCTGIEVDIYFRIVRINGDGSIRLVYSGNNFSEVMKEKYNITTTSHRSGSYTNILTSYGTGQNQRTTTYSAQSKVTGEVYNIGSTYLGYMYNPNLVSTITPTTKVKGEDNGNTSLSYFPTITNISKTTSYYFFTRDSFDVSKDCSGDTCTLTCNNFDTSTNTGANCIYSTFGDFTSRTDDNGNLLYSDDTSLGATSASYRWTDDYVYSCLGDGTGTATPTSGTVTVKCLVVKEILGLNKSGTSIDLNKAKVRYQGLFSKDYDTAITNVESSNVKTEVDNWYKNNILNKTLSDNNLMSDYLSDEYFCNDRDYYSGNGYNLENNKVTFYNSYRRISSTKVPTLLCQNKKASNSNNDKFTVSSKNGNGKLTYPIGLLSVDEVALAGGNDNFANSKFYLYIGQSYYWTMSPSYFYSTNGSVYVNQVLSNGKIDSYAVVSGKAGIRPVINLKAGTYYKSGSGTEGDPYLISYNDGTKSVS